MSIPTLRAAGCFLQYKEKFVILLRRTDKPDGGTWGLPAGKVDSGESDATSMLRELFEETGYQARPEEMHSLGIYEFPFPDLHLIFPVFRVELSSLPTVRHNPDEHSEYRWVTPRECYELPNLIRGFRDLLQRIGYIYT